MFEMWLLFTACVFTIVGYSMGKTAGTENAIEATLDVLIKMKVIQVRKNCLGQEEIICYYDCKGT